MKTFIAAAVLLTLTACATAPMNQDVLRQHAERNCRVDAAVSPAYAIDSTGGGTRNVAFEKCMASKGFTSL